LFLYTSSSLTLTQILILTNLPLPCYIHQYGPVEQLKLLIRQQTEQLASGWVRRSKRGSEENSKAQIWVLTRDNKATIV